VEPPLLFLWSLPLPFSFFQHACHSTWCTKLDGATIAFSNAFPLPLISSILLHPCIHPRFFHAGHKEFGSLLSDTTQAYYTSWIPSWVEGKWLRQRGIKFRRGYQAFNLCLVSLWVQIRNPCFSAKIV
jgi:hypothetical protein